VGWPPDGGERRTNDIASETKERTKSANSIIQPKKEKKKAVGKPNMHHIVRNFFIAIIPHHIISTTPLF